DQFLDAVLKNILPALPLLERRAKGDYEPDELPKTFPPLFTQRRDQEKSPGPTPSELFEAWVKARHPSHSTVESWRTVFNALIAPALHHKSSCYRTRALALAFYLIGSPIALIAEFLLISRRAI